VLYRKSVERYRSSGPPFSFDLGSLTSWSSAPEGLRRLVEENGESLALYREAADRPDSSPAPDRPHGGSSMLHWLALLEALRQEDRGDMTGAWDWYRAILRTIRHGSAYTSQAGRIHAQDWHDRLRERVGRWAAERRTTPAMIRRALDAIACRSIPPPSDSYTLVAECLEPDARERLVTVPKWNEIFGVPDYYVNPDQMQTIYDLWRFWHREPERSRRVIRLAIANWLAYEHLPPDRRPPRDLKVRGRYDFYAFGPEVAPEARALSPVALHRWLDSSPEARQFLQWWTEHRASLIKGNGLEKLRDRERANHRALVVLLASQLYRRDQGSDPPTPEALVGPYLRSLPEAVDDGSQQATHEAGKPLQ
jgi:hypothetical protein